MYYIYNKMKECKKCNINKDLEKFPKNKTFISGRENVCKECKKEYYISNKEKILLRQKEYDINNNEKRKLYRVNYRKLNKSKSTERANLRYKNDINYRIKSCLRVRINSALKNILKKSSTLILLGCSISDFKQYLKSQFLPEFTWENHGKIWEIDHIIPCSKFDLTILEEQQKCFHYTNMKPIFKTTEIAVSYGYLDQIGNRNKRDQHYG